MNNPDPFIRLFPGTHKVNITREGIALFNSGWPGSRLRTSRSYWFEFGADGDLVDTDTPQHDDGPEAQALADDAKAWLIDDVWPEWHPNATARSTGA